MNKNNSQYLISPLLDFCLLGGVSLILFPLVIIVFPVNKLLMYNILPWFFGFIFFVDYLVNFPHFAYSYQLLYQNYSKKMTGELDRSLRSRYVFVGIGVPIIMITFFIIGYIQNSTQMIQHAANVMLLTAGWHYAKQGFGMLIVTSVYQKIFYSLWERRILLANAHLVWMYAWILFNTGAKEKEYFGIYFQTLGFIPIIERCFYYAICISTLVLVYLLYRKYRKESVLPPMTGITSYIASIYIWVILRFGFGTSDPIHPVIFLIPFMHGMQYITVVLKMKQNEVKKSYITQHQFTIFLALGIAIGFFLFELIPLFLDQTLMYNTAVYGVTYFMFMFWIFVNIHHYFIDNVIWRREGSEVKEYLFEK